MPDIGTELPNPQDVEQDVEEAAVKICRGEHGPPGCLAMGHAEDE